MTINLLLLVFTMISPSEKSAAYQSGQKCQDCLLISAIEPLPDLSASLVVGLVVCGIVINLYLLSRGRLLAKELLLLKKILA